MKYFLLPLIPILMLSCVKAERSDVDLTNYKSPIALLGIYNIVLYPARVRFRSLYSCGTGDIFIGLYVHCNPNISVSGAVQQYVYNTNILPLTPYTSIKPGKYYIGFEDWVCSSWIQCTGPLSFKSGTSYTISADSNAGMTVTSP